MPIKFLIKKKIIKIFLPLLQVNVPATTGEPNLLKQHELDPRGEVFP
jgi:hypothetical protein